MQQAFCVQRVCVKTVKGASRCEPVLIAAPRDRVPIANVIRLARDDGVMLTPDVGRLQTALVAAHRKIPIPSVA